MWDALRNIVEEY